MVSLFMIMLSWFILSYSLALPSFVWGQPILSISRLDAMELSEMTIEGINVCRIRMNEMFE